MTTQTQQEIPKSPFRNCHNSNLQGNVGLLAAKYWLTVNGWEVSTPETDSQPYDLIAVLDRDRSKIQVKTCTKDQVSLKTRHKTYSTPFDANNADYIFIFDHRERKFFIPVEDIGNINSISLKGGKYDKYLVY